MTSAEIHLWRIALDAIPGERVAHCAELLDEGERARAAGYRFAGHRDRFVASHGAMRQILGAYTGVAPERIAYREHANRKPALAGPAAEGDIRFSLTHSEDLALLAVARGLEIGVDVERVRPMRDALSLARRFFAPEEMRDLLVAGDAAAQEAAFFRCWTRKEAVLKATGEGLHFPLSAFAVTLLPGEPVAVRWDLRTGDAPRAWALQSFEPAPDYVAALAYLGDTQPARWFDWPPVS